jgi:hypothetical protein
MLIGASETNQIQMAEFYGPMICEVWTASVGATRNGGDFLEYELPKPRIIVRGHYLERAFPTDDDLADQVFDVLFELIAGFDDNWMIIGKVNKESLDTEPCCAELKSKYSLAIQKEPNFDPSRSSMFQMPFQKE